MGSGQHPELAGGGRHADPHLQLLGNPHRTCSFSHGKCWESISLSNYPRRPGDQKSGFSVTDSPGHGRVCNASLSKLLPPHLTPSIPEPDAPSLCSQAMLYPCKDGTCFTAQQAVQSEVYHQFMRLSRCSQDSYHQVCKCV